MGACCCYNVFSRWKITCNWICQDQPPSRSWGEAQADREKTPIALSWLGGEKALQTAQAQEYEPQRAAEVWEKPNLQGPKGTADWEPGSQRRHLKAACKDPTASHTCMEWKLRAPQTGPRHLDGSSGPPRQGQGTSTGWSLSLTFIRLWGGKGNILTESEILPMPPQPTSYTVFLNM